MQVFFFWDFEGTAGQSSRNVYMLSKSRTWVMYINNGFYWKRSMNRSPWVKLYTPFNSRFVFMLCDFSLRHLLNPPRLHYSDIWMPDSQCCAIYIIHTQITSGWKCLILQSHCLLHHVTDVLRSLPARGGDAVQMTPISLIINSDSDPNH